MGNWHQVAPLEEIPLQSSRVVKSATADIAVFRTAKGDVYAIQDVCPHKGGPLSQGMVAGNEVNCPLHGMRICLSDGKAVTPDKGCVITYPVRIEDGIIYLQV